VVRPRDLCRVVGKSGAGLVDEGVLPLAHFLDSRDGDAAAASVEVDEQGAIVPTIYIRSGGEVSEYLLEPHPLHEYVGETYSRAIAQALRPLRSLSHTRLAALVTPSAQRVVAW